MNSLHEQMLTWRKPMEPDPAKVEEDRRTAQEITLDALTRHDEQTTAKMAVAAVDTWLETGSDDLDEDEGLGGRLMSLFVGIADTDKDGEIDDDEQVVIDDAREVAIDYLLSKNVDEDDVDSLMNDWNDECAERVQEFLSGTMDSLDADEDADLTQAEQFIFSQSGYDQPTLDAVYKKKVAIRGGKKVKINKRMSGKVKLSPKQKLSIRKMQRKANTGAAKKRRAKSMKMRTKMGLK